MNPVEEYLSLINREPRTEAFYYEIERFFTDPNSFGAIANHAYRELLEWARIYGVLQLGTRLFDPLFFGVVQNPLVRTFESSIHRSADSFVSSTYEYVTRPNAGERRLKELLAILQDNELSALREGINKYVCALPGLTTHGVMFPIGSVYGDPGGSVSPTPTGHWSLFHVSAESVSARIEEAAGLVQGSWK